MFGDRQQDQGRLDLEKKNEIKLCFRYVIRSAIACAISSHLPETSLHPRIVSVEMSYHHPYIYKFITRLYYCRLNETAFPLRSRLQCRYRSDGACHLATTRATRVVCIPIEMW